VKRDPTKPKRKKPNTPLLDSPLSDAPNRALKAKIKAATTLVGDERKCRARAYIRDMNGERMKDAKGEYLRKPCGRWAMKGGTVCGVHGGLAPQVRKSAEKRLRMLVDPAIDRLSELMNQNEHLPTALGAIATAFKHTIGDGGAAGKKGGGGAPKIIIGVQFGALGTAPAGGAQVATVDVSRLLEEGQGDIEEGEVIEEDGEE
jgi:hypothetical protein